MLLRIPNPQLSPHSGTPRQRAGWPTPNPKTGFTLIELLVSITIIGILAGLLMANLSSSRARARDAERKSDLHQVVIALAFYQNDYNAYPIHAGGVELGSMQAELRAPDGSPYIRKFPTDPKFSGGQGYRYVSNADGTAYILWAQLENDQDPDREQAGVLEPTAEFAGTSGAEIVDPRYFQEGE